MILCTQLRTVYRFRVCLSVNLFESNSLTLISMSIKVSIGDRIVQDVGLLMIVGRWRINNKDPLPRPQ